jgi:type II secretory pathway pseudopilin PulG
MYKRVAADHSASFIGFDKSHSLWQTKFGDRLYSNNAQALDATPPGNKEDPLIYEMIFPTKLGNIMYTFVFFDTAGENLGDEEQMSILNKYIYKSSGIICLLDPFQISGIEDRIDSSVAEGSSSGAVKTSNIEALSNITNLIRNYRQMRRTEKIKAPIAIVFTKLDAIKELIPEGSTVLDPSPNDGAVNLNDIHNVDAEIKAFLLEWGEKAFITQVENDYEASSFFAVSALGFDNYPDAGNDRRVKKPQPHRVEDPFLWIMKRKGILDGNKVGFKKKVSRFRYVLAAAVLVLVVIGAAALGVSKAAGAMAEAVSNSQQRTAANNSTTEKSTTESSNAGNTATGSAAASNIANTPNSTSTVSNGDYIIPDSSSRLITESEILALSEWERYIARNEIFARHGRGFKNEDLREYFTSKSWYKELYSPEKFDSMSSPLNDYERKNSTLLLSVEKREGSPYAQ